MSSRFWMLLMSKMLLVFTQTSTGMTVVLASSVNSELTAWESIMGQSDQIIALNPSTKTFAGLWDHFNQRGYMYLLVLHWPALSGPLSLPNLTLCWTTTEHSIPDTCLKLSTDKVRGQPEEERREKGKGVAVVGREGPLYERRGFSLRSCVCLQRPCSFFNREEGRAEGERCCSFSELPGHVCALTCMVSWLIKPSRCLFELFETG